MQTDWSKEVLRACTSATIDFREAAGENGSVAIARPRRGLTAPERHLTLNEVALLSALKSPRALPRALHDQVRDCDRVLAQLVLDGLVEVRRGGRFLSGVAALEIVEGVRDGNGKETSGISELALQYALAVRHLKPDIVAERLYAFNSLPRKRSQHRNPAAEFSAHTGIDVSSPSPMIGGREWAIQSSPGWLYFRRGNSPGRPFKIYLCPRPKDVPNVIPGFAEVLGRARGSVFKIAFPSDSLVRADKIVAYLPTFEALQRALTDLVSLSLDAPVQAVPFSAPVPRAPLLSWGVDPPNLDTHKASSWRSWVTRQVAECVHNVPATGTPAEALDHLKTALQLRDIDPVNWLPLQQLLSRKWRLDL